MISISVDELILEPPVQHRLTLNISVWLFFQVGLLSHALILDLPTHGFFYFSSASPIYHQEWYTSCSISPTISPCSLTKKKRRHCRAEILQVLANGIPRVYEPLRGSRDLIAPAGVRSSESVPFNQIQNEFSTLFTRLSPGLQKNTRELESH